MISKFSWRTDDDDTPPLEWTHTQGSYVHSALSNFYPCKVKLEGVVYPSVENAYQAAKAAPGLDGTVDRSGFVDCTPGQAKKAGRQLMLRPDWEQVKLAVMGLLVVQKFTVHEPLRVELLATGDHELVEGNTWGDTFWGKVWRPESIDYNAGWFGENELGQILMGTRELLRRVAGPASASA